MTDVTARPPSNNPGMTLWNSPRANSHFQTQQFFCLCFPSCFPCDLHHLVLSQLLWFLTFKIVGNNSFLLEKTRRLWQNEYLGNVYQHVGILTLWPRGPTVVHLLTKKQINKNKTKNPKPPNLPLFPFQILWRIPSQYLHFPEGNAWEPAAKCWCLHAPVCLFFKM